MCGIVGCVGTINAIKPVVNGLNALEYRGYDSSGVTYLDRSALTTTKQAGRVKNIEKSLDKKSSTLAIGHTRWATHGSPSTKNAHPHFNSSNTIAVVHNGIVENHTELKNKLEKEGYKFVSETDTEVIPHLLDFNNKSCKSFEGAFRETIKQLRGAYAIAAVSLDQPDTLYVARLSSPLVIGVGSDSYLIASDQTAISDYAQKVIFLDDYEIAVIKKNSHTIHNIQKSVMVEREAQLMDADTAKTSLGDFPHFMLKEIHETPQAIQLATLGRAKPETATVKLGGLEAVSEQLNFIDRIVIVACGTSYYAGLIGEYLIEEIAGIPVEVQLASEFKYRNEPFSRSTALIAISQSGETADTIAALKKVEGYGVLKLGVVNATGSTIARMTDAGVYCHAGPEQSVASTKAFVSQVTVLSLIALHLSQGRTPLYKAMLQEMVMLPNKASEILKQADGIEKIAKKYSRFRDFLYIGRTYGYPSALEGALKLKEISYIHAEGFAAGEMKHGPLAMIDKDFPSLVIATDSPTIEKVYSNVEEIKARGGKVVAIATKGNKKIAKLADDVIYIPKTLEQTSPQLIAIALQLFSYYIAVDLGKNVDRPRNLAKSVTVE